MCWSSKMAYGEAEAKQRQWTGDTGTICPRCEQEYDADKYEWKVLWTGESSTDIVMTTICDICLAILVLDSRDSKIHAFYEEQK